MQGGRANTGGKSVPMGGKQSTRTTGNPQPVPQATRHQPASSGPRRTGSVELANVDSAGLIAAGQQTGSPPQPVQQPQPASQAQREVYDGQKP
jgi:hypothetical protein